MNVLGLIASDTGAHPAACLVQDGRLVAFAEEERFVRVKQAYGYFPSRAARFCCERGGVSLDGLDALAFGWDATAYRWRFPLFLARSFVRQRLSAVGEPGLPNIEGRPVLGSAVASGLRSLIGYQPRVLTEKIVLGLREGGLTAARLPPVVFVKHHRAHAASAFFCSGLSEAAVLVFDGHGEQNAVTLWRGQGTRLELLQQIDVPNSLGWFYSAFTEYLGWNPNEGEVKLMGLAPFGKRDAGIERYVAEVLQVADDGICVDASQLFYGPRSQGRFFSDALVHRLGPPRAPGEPLTDRHRDVARAVQRRLEEAAVALAARALHLAGCRDLCLAGGVALNCKMNGEILKRGLARRLFVQPLAHDAGAALGAAQVVALERGDECRFELEHLAWGPEYDDADVEVVLRRNRIGYRRSDHVEDDTARMLADGRIVGWFQGRMEGGPRALGNRSILADPRPPDMKDRVNDRVKFRETWRPFALSVQAERFGDYVTNPVPSPFMIMAYDVLPERESAIASAMHWVDKTTRPQTVRRDLQPRFWGVLEAFRRLTGVAGLLNTSFNAKDEPLVCTPNDALRSFFGSGMDALVMGSFVIEKAGQRSSGERSDPTKAEGPGASASG